MTDLNLNKCCMMNCCSKLKCVQSILKHAHIQDFITAQGKTCPL